MPSYPVIAFTAVLAVLSPIGITSAQAPQAVEKRQQTEERGQAEERTQDMEKRQDAEHRQDAQRRPDMGQREQAERRQDAVARSMAPGLARAEEMVGLRVVNRQDKTGLGKVTALGRNGSGEIDEVVIEHGGFMGFFTDSVVVPRERFELSADGKTVITDMDRSQLRAATPYKRK